MGVQVGAVGTAADLWRNRVATSGDRVGYRTRDKDGWRTVTWREADTAAREVGAGLVSLGLAAGQTVAILSQTRLEWLLADVGTLLAGGVTVPIYPSTTSEQCAYILRNAGVTLAIVEDAAQLAKVAPHARELGLRCVRIHGDQEGDELSWEQVRAAGRAHLSHHPDELAARTARLAPEDSFTIIYTSGTTGLPKGVVLTHENLVAACASASRALTLIDTDEQYLFLPLAHVLGREMLWATVLANAPTAFSRGLSRIRDDLVEVRPTFLAGVPRVFEKFHAAVLSNAKRGSAPRRALFRWALAQGAGHSRKRQQGRPGGGLRFGLADRLVLSRLRLKLGLDRCRFLLSGGAPLAAEIAEFFHAAGVLILEGYGLTETMAAAFVNRLDRYRFGTVGPALDVVESRIQTDGEILLRGPSVFRRYHQDQAATDEAINAAGWFHTGDIGVLEDGFLRITDRKKDIIVTSGGKNVAPQPLENALKARSSLVSQVLVYGDRRPYCVALITISEEAVRRFGGGDPLVAASNAELQRALAADIGDLNRSLASHETIKNFSVLEQDFTEASGELTPSLKVKRKVVIERHRARIDGLYAGAAA